MTSASRPRILLIDDSNDLIDELHQELSAALKGEEVEIVTWAPSSRDDDPDEALAKHAPPSTVMVITDYDLTRQGMRGFQGSAVQSWCLRRLIPVGEFSRRPRDDLPKEPDLFGMNVPAENVAAAKFVAAAYKGFEDIKNSIKHIDDKSRSISGITAEIIGRNNYEPVLSLYFSRLVSSNTAIRTHLSHLSGKSEESVRQDRLDLMAYVIGHVLLNLILAFPGPILSREVLAAYLAVSEANVEEIVDRAKVPPYEGPFADIQPYVWREDVDATITRIVSDSDKEPPEDSELYNRFAAELILGKSADTHECRRDRCGGIRGGYWCPFTKRTVCLRDDCSEASTAWIPDGADLCRVEADFFEEFAPLLGL